MNFTPPSFHPWRRILLANEKKAIWAPKPVWMFWKREKMSCLCRDSNTAHNHRQKLKWSHEGNVNKQVRQIRRYERERITVHVIRTLVDLIYYLLLVFGICFCLCLCMYSLFTWGVQVLSYPNFFLGEWKQIETWKLLKKTWLFFRLGEAKWQHCTTRWMLLTRSSCSSVFDTEMATFTFE